MNPPILLLLLLMTQTILAQDCSQPPYNCPDCLYQNHQCVPAQCASKLNNLVQSTSVMLGWVQYNQQRVEVQFDVDEYELTLNSCIDIQLYRLTNKWTLPYQEILTDFQRIPSTNSMASYTFYISQNQFADQLISIQDSFIQQFEGYYSLEFKSNGLTVARYFFQFQMILSMIEVNDILYTNFFAVKEMNTLYCPDESSPADQCSLQIESQLLLCSDNSIMCLSQVPLCPGQFVENQELYLAHQITQPGFEEWSLAADVIQLYDLQQGVFLQLSPLSVATQINRIIYHVKISTAIPGTQIGVSSILVQPSSGRRRRVLTSGLMEKTTQASCSPDPTTTIIPQQIQPISPEEIADLATSALHSADYALTQASTAINISGQLISQIQQSSQGDASASSRASMYWTEVQAIADASIQAFAATQTAKTSAAQAKQQVSVLKDNPDLLAQTNEAFEKTRQAVELSYLAKASAQTMEGLIQTVEQMTSINTLPMNPCGLPPINCPECTLYNYQCFLPSCVEKIARIGSPNAGIGKLSLDFQGQCETTEPTKLHIKISYVDSENDPFERNTDGSIQTCIEAQLFRLTNQWELPYEQVPLQHERSFIDGRRTYSFDVLLENLTKDFVQLEKQGDNLVFEGYFVYEFQVQSKAQARYFFSVTVTINENTSSILNTDFKSIKEYDSLICPNQNNNEECVLAVDSDLNFCKDATLDCTMESKETPELYLNQIFYISHKITTNGFENWMLVPNLIQFYNLGSGFFQEVVPSRYNQNGNRIVYELKVSFVQNSVTLACNSILTPPTLLSAIHSGRRALQMNTPKTTSAQSQEFECIRKSIDDPCPVPVNQALQQNPNDDSKAEEDDNQAGYILMMSLIIFCIA